LLERLAAEPRRAGLFVDFDGVLAPIVEHPDDAYPPPEAQEELQRLVHRYAIVAVVSGRAGDDVRRRVGVDGVVYVGSHGLELDSRAEVWRARIDAFANESGWDDTERKGLAVSFHYRRAEDEAAAIGELESLAEQARSAGLVARFGRKVLEVLPTINANKGTAVRRLLADLNLHRALVAGDDTTDLDAFRALDELELAVRVAVAADESPPELRASSDVVVGSTQEFLALLKTL